MAKSTVACPRCKGPLRRHCPSPTCTWWLCVKEKDAWVPKVSLDPDGKPRLKWGMATYWPEPMGPLPRPSV